MLSFKELYYLSMEHQLKVLGRSSFGIEHLLESLEHRSAPVPSSQYGVPAQDFERSAPTPSSQYGAAALSSSHQFLEGLVLVLHQLHHHLNMVHQRKISADLF